MMNNSPIIDALQWRYATKKFDASKKVSEADLHELLEAARLAPSSYGLQPWGFVVVTDPALRKRLREHAWNQAQIEDASHLIVLCARTDVDEKFVKRYVESIAKTRNVPVESIKGYEDMMVGFVKGETPASMVAWAQRQVYLALGVLLEAAALKRIDACPMEGFDPAKFDEVLALKKHNLTAAVLCTLGYRAADDHSAKHLKVRFSANDVVLKK
jgi:nitroreductase